VLDLSEKNIQIALSVMQEPLSFDDPAGRDVFCKIKRTHLG